ncbi:Na(+)/H(+) exchange regulatory cofactor NHE-RF4 isoform X2 [Lepisosteus oculatus]|uniref:Na(+)/H(+) exchange regulatory cofactor NHE-RF4 isoform X2 n=1 Tax=Lepisosteus oculatus TaxID=7918 RepID=UPI003717DFA5
MKQKTGLEGAMELTQKFTFNPKEGIDNPALVITDDPERESGPTPRLCQMRREKGESFGFYLRLELGLRGHVVREVEPWSVAERSGLRDGDRLLEVNQDFVDTEEHWKVVRKIQASGQQVSLLVLGGGEYEQALAEGRDLLALAREHRGEATTRPRLCHVTREHGAGLGFTVSAVDGRKGKFCVTTMAGGPAEKAGVRSGDRLLWINGASASDLTHSALSKMIRTCVGHVTVLVIESASEQSYARRGVSIFPAMAEIHNLPHRPRTLHLVQCPAGYGFLLRQEKMPSGRIVHALREVEPDSPAERAGMREGDQLLAVNGEAAEGLEHEDVVSRVRSSGRRVAFTAIDSQGGDYYYQDDTPEKEKTVPPPALAAPPAGPPHEAHSELPLPRICQLERGPKGFGFRLSCVQDEPGTCIGQVAAGGPGQRAGLRAGDVVVEVNGQSVAEEPLEEVARRMKEAGPRLDVLVVDRRGYGALKQSGTPVAASLAHATQVRKGPNNSFI